MKPLLCTFTLAISLPLAAAAILFPITPDDLKTEDSLSSCAIHGDYWDAGWAVGGAWGADDKGPHSGAAYFIRRLPHGWEDVQRVTPIDGQAGDSFGFHVDIDSEEAFISAKGNNNQRGAVYVFRRNGGNLWGQVQKLTAADGTSLDYFGPLAVDGNYLLVGAYGNDDQGSNSGSAYIFEKAGNSWNQKAKLLASDGAAFDQFGHAVDLSGDFALVGALGADAGATNTGAAYVFERNGDNWTEVAKLTAGDGQANDNFGEWVAISGDYCLVGAEGAGVSGAAYIFKRVGDNWEQQETILTGAGAFGQVSLAGNRALIGAYDDNTGSATLYERDGDDNWNLVQKIVPNNGNNWEDFGHFIALSRNGKLGIVGSSAFNANNQQATGRIYICDLRKPEATYLLRGNITSVPEPFGRIIFPGHDILTLYTVNRYTDDALPNNAASGLYQNDITNLKLWFLPDGGDFASQYATASTHVGITDTNSLTIDLSNNNGGSTTYSWEVTPLHGNQNLFSSPVYAGQQYVIEGFSLGATYSGQAGTGDSPIFSPRWNTQEFLLDSHFEITFKEKDYNNLISVEGEITDFILIE